MPDPQEIDFYHEADAWEKNVLGAVLGELVMGEIRHENTGTDLSLTEWRNVLAEEVGEAFEALGAARLGEGQPELEDHLERELCQVAATCVAMVGKLRGEDVVTDEVKARA